MLLKSQVEKWSSRG